MKNLLFLVPTILLATNFCLWIMLGRQKERRLSSKEEIYEAMQDEVYQKNTLHLDVVAGEANIEIYWKLCKIIQNKLSEGSLEMVNFIIGPSLSTWETEKTVLDHLDKIKPEFQKPGKIKELHPLFQLLLDYPDKVNVYYKKPNTKIENEPHFVLTDTLIYTERPHKPLNESKAMIIENPNILMRNKYSKKLDNIKTGTEVVKLTTEKEVWETASFSYFQPKLVAS